MCKIGKKIKKINFNKFIWLYYKKNVYIFLGGFPIAGMRINEKKKKKVQGTWNGLLPILVLSHDTMHCIMTGKAGRLAWAQFGGHDMVGLARSKACDTATVAATIRPREGMTRPAAHAGMRQRACMAWPLG